MTPDQAIPYLGLLREQLATTLRPHGDEAAEQTAMYSHRVLTQLLLKARLVPELHRTALAALAANLDALSAELREIEGGETLAAELVRSIRSEPDYAAAEPGLQRAVTLLAAGDTDRARTMLKSIAAILLRMQQAVHEATLAEEMPPASGDKAIEPLSVTQKQALREFLRGCFAQESSLEIGGTRAIVGGASKQTIFVDLMNTASLPSRVVLRIDRADSAVGSTVADEFELVRTLFDAGIPVPRPFALGTDTAIVGGAFMVVSRIDGINIGDGFDVFAPSRDFALTLARALARLHDVPPGLAPQLPGAKVTITERMLANMDEFEAYWRQLGVPSVALEMAYGWLRRNIHVADGKRAIVHRDVACHNMLARDGRLAAILDWETAVIGSPAQDLGYAYHTVTQMIGWDEFLAEYVRAGGTLPSPIEIDFYRLWRSVWIMYFMLVSRHSFESGATTAPIAAYAGQYWYHRSDIGLHEMVDLVYSTY